MPIVVTTPAQGDSVGPGTIIRASTQSVLPVGHHWDALIFQPGTEDIIGNGLTFVEGQSAEFVMNVRTVQPGQREVIWNPIPAYPTTGSEWEMHVRVVSAQSTLVDTSGPIGINWRPDPAGVAYVQSLEASSVVSGGFTQADRDQAELVYAAVNPTFLAGIGPPSPFSIPIGDFFINPPDITLTRAESLLLTGRGTLKRPAGGTQVEAYGAICDFTIIPPQLGFRDGQVQEMEERIAQFVVVRSLTGPSTYLADVFDVHTSGEDIRWGKPFPPSILYDILPGCQVRWTWLVGVIPI